MLKKMAAGLLCLCLLLGICPECSAAQAPEPFRLVVGTDLHYISPALNDKGPFFRDLLDRGDGKTSLFCEELTDAFLEEVCRLKPDALLLTGDLSFNGALESHRDLAEKLRAVEAAGIPVLVLTGNHDVYCGSAARFEGKRYTLVPSATTESFREIYAEFGWDEALSRDAESLSYCYALNDGTRILMLDANTARYSSALPPDTVSWVEQQLKDAAKQGCQILVACHQNLLQHSMFDYGYVLTQSAALLKLFQKYDVRLCLSGHLHMQHVMEKNGVTEIATSALCSYPCQYGVLAYANGVFQYHTQITDVSAWAKRQGREEEELQDFSAYAASLFDRRTLSQTVPLLAESHLSPGQQASMNVFACEVNRSYFSGHMEGYEALDPDGSLRELWVNTGSLYGYYLDSIQSDAGNNYNEWTIG